MMRSMDLFGEMDEQVSSMAMDVDDVDPLSRSSPRASSPPTTNSPTPISSTISKTISMTLISTKTPFFFMGILGVK
ncbi:hypothetical protein glysoja_041622 [Glycine soja]|uniref:Uncharacterized protein n=1 Tax=Glycine soja TaxID=3848 RepID=A0A0B2Q203_GLYSO|nr:hypothetical protein glysoja_041622 [Glycine soja]